MGAHGIGVIRDLVKVTLLDSRTTASQNCDAVPRRARIQGTQTFVSLNSRLESNKGQESASWHWR